MVLHLVVASGVSKSTITPSHVFAHEMCCSCCPVTSAHHAHAVHVVLGCSPPHQACPSFECAQNDRSWRERLGYVASWSTLTLVSVQCMSQPVCVHTRVCTCVCMRTRVCACVCACVYISLYYTSQPFLHTLLCVCVCTCVSHTQVQMVGRCGSSHRLHLTTARQV